MYQISNKTLVKVSISLQLVLLVLLFTRKYLNYSILDTACLLTGLIYIFFVPGILILTVLRNTTNIAEYLIYDVGLSLSYVMLAGFVSNFLIEYFKVSCDFTTLLILGTIGMSALVYLLFSKNIIQEIIILKFEFHKIYKNRIIILAAMLPLIAVICTYLLDYYDCNLGDILLLSTLSILPLLVTIFKRAQNEYDYAVLIYAISLALLYHVTLFSNNLVGHDIHKEFYYSILVTKNGLWNWKIPSNINSILSITILPPAISKICKINMIWVFKIIFPLIFSLTPVVAYIYIKSSKYENNIRHIFAFLSICYFMYIYVYYLLVSTILRQQIAMLYLSLIILVFVKGIEDVAKKTLLVIFTSSLVVSHYGTTYIYLILLVIIFFVNLIKRDIKLFSNNYFIYTICMLLAWYIYIGSSAIYVTLIKFATHIYTSLINFETTRKLQYIGAYHYTTIKVPLSVQLIKIVDLASFMLVLIGMFSYLVKKHIHPEILNKKLCYFSITSAVFITLFITLPHSTYSQVGTGRVYLILLLTLCPFYILGLYNIAHTIKYHRQNISKKVMFRRILVAASILILIILILNSGIASYLLGDYIWSPYITKKETVNIFYKERKFDVVNRYYMNYFPQEDFQCARWINGHRTLNIIYADPVSIYTVLFSQIGPPSVSLTHILTNKSTLFKGCYIYLRYLNIHYNIFPLKYGKSRLYTYTRKLIKKVGKNNLCKIYNSNGCIVYSKQ